MTSTPSLARKHGSPIQHLLVGPRRTWCGDDATLMARWAPADVPTDSKVWRTCEACRAAKTRSDEIRDGSRCYDCGHLFAQPEAVREAATNLDDWNALEPAHVGCFQ